MSARKPASLEASLAGLQLVQDPSRHQAAVGAKARVHESAEPLQSRSEPTGRTKGQDTDLEPRRRNRTRVNQNSVQPTASRKSAPKREKALNRASDSSLVSHYLQFEENNLFALTKFARRAQDARLGCTDYVAIDCEMISTLATRNAAARVSLVNEYGSVLLDVHVVPDSQVLDYRSKWSGIRPSSFKTAGENGTLWSLDKVKSELHSILTSSRTLVGHSVQNDLRVLGFHEGNMRFRVIDTQKLPRFGKQAGLKRLVKEYFDISIQDDPNGHDSVEDARSSMLLFRTFQHEFETLNRKSL